MTGSPNSRKRSAMPSDGKLATIFREAMRGWDAMKADGIPIAERVKALEASLRQAWPFTREWKYLCVECNDTGFVLSECHGDATCGREKRHGPHTFGRPCWCSLGARFRPKARPNLEDVEAAGKVSKPMTRFNR